jgi:hypothetical protein
VREGGKQDRSTQSTSFAGNVLVEWERATFLEISASPHRSVALYLARARNGKLQIDAEARKLIDV